VSTSKLLVALLLVATAAGVALAVFYNPPRSERATQAAPPVANEDLEVQGVAGHVLLPNGQPAVGVHVTLLPRVSDDPIQAFLLAKTGGAPTPVATGETLADGSFSLTTAATPTPLDLRVTAKGFPEITRTSIVIIDGEWFDAGDVQLQPGAVVTGRVVDAMSNKPIANATVHVHPGGVMTTGADGTFRCATVPQRGSVRFKIEAAGYATRGLKSQKIDTATENTFEFELNRAQLLHGVVLDMQRNPIAGARIKLRRLDSGQPGLIEIACRADGTFSWDVDSGGSYELIASASNHVSDNQMVADINDDIEFVLRQRGVAKLRVLDPERFRVPQFEVSLWHVATDQRPLRPVRHLSARKIDESHHEDGWARVDDLPEGTFSFAVDDGRHTVTLSEPFEITFDDAAVEVITNLGQGASITGKVVDKHGNRIPNALVSARPKQTFTSGFTHPESNWIAPRSLRQVHADASGSFVLTGLSLGPYLLQASHEGFCIARSEEIMITTADKPLAVDLLRLRRGAIVHGIASIDGKPTGHIEIQLETHPDRRARNPDKTFFTKTLSDENGRYEFLSRVPPGHYWISGAPKDIDSVQRLITLQTSGRALMITDIRKPIEVPFDIRRR